VKRSAFWVAAVVVLVSNAWALGHAWMNRAGAPSATLELTEREVRLTPRDSENTAVSLRLIWIDPSRGTIAPTWFDAAKLASVGFDCRGEVTRENASRYRGQAPRAGYAAFEFGGEAWDRYLASLPDVPDRESAMRGPHLVLVDVDLDPSALRSRHPDQHRVAVVRASFGLTVVEPPGHPAFLAGRLNTVYPEELNVPREFRGDIERLAASDSGPFDPRQVRKGSPLIHAPRFVVNLRWGRMLEPRIEGIRLAAFPMR
jgi:hypothetical protein